MRAKTAKTIRRWVKLSAQINYRDAKRAWNELPRNKRAAARQEMSQLIEDRQ